MTRTVKDPVLEGGKDDGMRKEMGLQMGEEGHGCHGMNAEVVVVTGGQRQAGGR